MKNITFAGGCFWGIEEYFSRIDGVLSTTVGYVNGHKKEPTYEEVCSGRTGHAEAVSLDFNPDIVSLKDLLKAYWAIIDPTVLNRQGPDRGTQYRTGIYYTDSLDLPVITESLNQEQLDYVDPIVTEVLPLDYYYDAEGYHQDYLKKNPGGYCHIKLD
jgi:peptide-methionine (S)-S-oxide reductase